VPDIEFPSLYSNEEIGESALEHALPWDRIDAVEHPRLGGVGLVEDDVRALHLERIQGNPDFEYRRNLRQYADGQRGRKTLSLNQQKRELEQEEADATLLAIENRRREVLGKKVATDLEELDELQRGEDEEDAADAEVEEAAKILTDYMALVDKRRVVRRR
jgi:carboxyl-terminal processing protease